MIRLFNKAALGHESRPMGDPLNPPVFEIDPHTVQPAYQAMVRDAFEYARHVLGDRAVPDVVHWYRRTPAPNASIGLDPELWPDLNTVGICTADGEIWILAEHGPAAVAMTAAHEAMHRYRIGRMVPDGHRCGDKCTSDEEALCNEFALDYLRGRGLIAA